MLLRLLKATAFFALALSNVNADLPIYTDGALAEGWENWSWGSTIDFAATDLFLGSSSISVNSTAYAALSLYYEGTFPDYAGLQFDIAVCLHCEHRSNLCDSLVACFVGCSTRCDDQYPIYRGWRPI